MSPIERVDEKQKQTPLEVSTAKQGTCFSLLTLQIHNTIVAVPQRNIHEGIKVDLYIFTGYSLN